MTFRVATDKQGGNHGGTGYPQLRLLALVACGTRTLIDAVFGPTTTGETTYAPLLLRSLHAGMILLADRNFGAKDLLADIAATGADALVDPSVERWLLVGDNGGHAPEVFADVIRQAPERVAAVGMRQTLAPDETRTGMQETAATATSSSARQARPWARRCVPPHSAERWYAACFGALPPDVLLAGLQWWRCSWRRPWRTRSSEMTTPSSEPRWAQSPSSPPTTRSTS